MMKPTARTSSASASTTRWRSSARDDPDLRPTGGFSMRGHSVGGFGSVTTNKVIATIAGNVFGKDVQAYPKYGSEKKGLPTTYYLTIADSHIYMHSELEHVDLLCINDPTAILSPLTLEGLLPGGAIFMQSPYTDPVDVWKRIPAANQQIIREKKIRVYFCDMVKIAREVASEADLQMRMQGIVLLGAFLKLTPYAKRERHDRRAGLRGRREGAAQVLRQARRPRRAGQPDLRQARLQRNEGDPARSHDEGVIQPHVVAARSQYRAERYCEHAKLQAYNARSISMMSQQPPRPSMNEANERDPFNNNSYGTLVDSRLQARQPAVLDVNDFNERIIRGYEEGCGERICPPTCRSPAR